MKFIAIVALQATDAAAVANQLLLIMQNTFHFATLRLKSENDVCDTDYCVCLWFDLLQSWLRFYLFARN